jgi:hypothetical protein
MNPFFDEGPPAKPHSEPTLPSRQTKDDWLDAGCSSCSRPNCVCRAGVVSHGMRKRGRRSSRQTSGMNCGAGISTTVLSEHLEGSACMVASFLRQRRHVAVSARATPAPVRIASVSDGVCKRDSPKVRSCIAHQVRSSMRYATITLQPHTVLTTLYLSKNMRARTRQPLRDNAV